jgi:acetolactate synthase-1/2/3 large subunit
MDMPTGAAGVPQGQRSNAMRGADVVMRTLERAGVRTVFTLSGNHIMPLFDAAFGTGVRLIHVRHEAAAVHMADAFARLTRQVGVAMVTGGPGHTNAVAALYTAQAAESPVVLLSGHVGLGEMGRGAFQDLDQAGFAGHIAKAAWTAGSHATLGRDVAEAIRIARLGRPGAVHLSLPFDLLEQETEAAVAEPDAADFAPAVLPLSNLAADGALSALAAAERPLILAGPTLCDAPGRALLARLADATGVPAVGMEGPRGLNDATLGAFAEALARADLLLLLGRPHDFAIRFAEPPHVAPDCRFVVIDPDAALIERAVREKGARVLLSAVADSVGAAEALILRATAAAGRHAAWRRDVEDAIRYRPPAWQEVKSPPEGPVHSIDLCRAVAPFVEGDPHAILVCEGGEIGQWPQSLIRPARRVINGPAGSIGAAIPFAVAARLVEPRAPVIAVMGDGAFGFHMAEFDTALRYGLSFVVVLGNDARWNAEHQIQLREYGANRAHGCELLPTRYDKVVEALAGHGELVTRPADLAPAIARALASGKPACVNVMIESVPAPTVRRT